MLSEIDLSHANAVALNTVTDDFAFWWKHLNFRYPQNYDPWIDQIKLRRVDYIAPKTPNAKIGEGLLIRGFFANRWNITVCVFFLFYSNSPTAQIESRTYAYHIPDDVVWAKGVLFGGHNTK